jgi:hypothetical protein
MAMFALLAATDPPPTAALVGAAAGVLALAWNIFNYLWARRPHVRVLGRVELPTEQDSSSYGAQITVVNVGHTVESVLEVGLCWDLSPMSRWAMRWSRSKAEALTPVSPGHSESGRTDPMLAALRGIERAIERTGERRTRLWPFGLGQGLSRSPAWALPPGGIAQIDQTFLVGLGDDGHTEMTPGAPTIAGTMRPYARLARGTARFGQAIIVDAQTIEATREQFYADRS